MDNSEKLKWNANNCTSYQSLITGKLRLSLKEFAYVTSSWHYYIQGLAGGVGNQFREWILTDT